MTLSMEIKPSKPFSNGTEYEVFVSNFCHRCKHGIISEEGYAEYPENGGCKIWDALENARFDLKVFPCEDVVQIVKNGYAYWHVCRFFKTDDEHLMIAYRKMFGDTEKENEHA